MRITVTTNNEAYLKIQTRTREKRRIYFQRQSVAFIARQRGHTSAKYWQHDVTYVQIKAANDLIQRQTSWQLSFRRSAVLWQTLRTDWMNCEERYFTWNRHNNAETWAMWDIFYTGSSKKIDGVWNRYNLKSTRRIYTFGVLKCSEKFKVLDLP